jgi:hypothetical protein
MSSQLPPTIIEDLVPVVEHVDRLVRLGYPLDEAIDFRLAGREDRLRLEPALNLYVAAATAVVGNDEQRISETVLATIRRHAGLTA